MQYRYSGPTEQEHVLDAPLTVAHIEQQQQQLLLEERYPSRLFLFPVHGASQNKLIRDAKGEWYLLAFRSDPTDDLHGTDYVDVYGVSFAPFVISHLLFSVHVFFKPGNTGFASTGTHYVEKSGRLLLASSYRWAEDEGPGESSFVSRVDECPSA